jgi:hypothetical protein
MAVLTATVASGCPGGDTDPNAQPADPGAQDGNDGNDGGNNGGGNPGGDGDKGSPWLIRWITDLGPGGPAGGADDPAWDAYRMLERRDCAEALSVADTMDNELDRQVYAGAANACLAILRGEAERWAAADAAFTAAERGLSGASEVTCYDQGVYALLRTVVGHHRDDPERGFDLGPGGMPTRCVRFDRLEPARVPVTGGIEVTLHGESLPPTMTVKVYGDAVDRAIEVTPSEVSGDGTRATLVMPPADRPGPAELGIKLGSNRGEAIVDFIYEPAAESTPDDSGEQTPEGDGQSPTG